ncbi:methionine biosynthesis protein MetW [Polaribacter sp. L3A8]|uniref:methionine biosynthesis protein MetW n=1 Tax=Polaribacter sp. L3A8 TaxID=2686361 RepID=UPI00131CF1BE|nr:methionine biosynthesis protein MetW [Polaribacter sp. L3A8]
MKNELFKKCKVCKSSITKINKQHHLVKCNNCNLIFCEKIYNEEEFIAVYNKLYNSLKPQYAVHSIKEFKDLQNGKINIGYHRKRIINKTVKNKSKVLEIGSGVGLIGMYLTKTKNIIYQGIEIDEETHLKAKGLGINSIMVIFL